MSQPFTNRRPVLFALGALAFAALHLAVEHLSGSIRSHHLLNRSDLPAISNWYGLLVLPLLGYICGVRVQRVADASGTRMVPRHVWFGLTAALLYGGVLAGSFSFGATQVTSIMFRALIVLAVLLPIYRAEYILGLVIGMTFTFGAVLPTLVASVLGIISFVVRSILRAAARLVRPSPKQEGPTL